MNETVSCQWLHSRQWHRYFLYHQNLASNAGNEAKCRDLVPPGYTTTSFPHVTSNHGGGIAFIVCDHLQQLSTLEFVKSAMLPAYKEVCSLASLNMEAFKADLNVNIRPESTITDLFHTLHTVLDSHTSLTPHLGTLPWVLSFWKPNADKQSGSGKSLDSMCTVRSFRRPGIMLQTLFTV